MTTVKKRVKKRHIRFWKIPLSRKRYGKRGFKEGGRFQQVMQPIRRRSRYTLNKPIVHFAYHKAMTTLFRHVFDDVAKYMGFTVKRGRYWTPCDMFVAWHGETAVPVPFVGSHVVRDPRDMIVSGYFYHKWCREPHVKIPQQSLGGLSRQQFLNQYDKQTGLTEEIRLFRSTAKPLLDWEPKQHVIEMRYEDIFGNEVSALSRIFRHYGLPSQLVRRLHYFFKQRSFGKPASRSRHQRRGLPGDWRNHFSDEQYRLFLEIYPGLLEKYGYEI